MVFLVCPYDVLFIADNQAINKETDLPTHNTGEVSQFSSLLGNFLSFLYTLSLQEEEIDYVTITQ